MGIAPSRVGLLRAGVGALVGLLSAGTAVGVGELVAAFVRPASSPIIVVGNRLIVLTPESIRRWAIREFGTNDKPTLLTGIYVAIAVLAVVVGVVAMRSVWAGVAGLGLFGVIGCYCALTTIGHKANDITPTIIATLAGAYALYRFIPVASRALAPPEPGTRQTSGPDRRLFLRGGIATAGFATVAGFGGRALQHRRYDVSKARAAVTLPAPASPAPALASGTDLGLTTVPFDTPNVDEVIAGQRVKGFYRIDTALTVPQIDPKTWQLRIHGMVDREITLSYADLLAKPLIERWITLTCVSNLVGGDLISNAKFLGARLDDILREAGVQSGASQLLMTDSAGMTIGAPVAAATDGRDAMLAVGMNDVPLPIEHGFPVRVVIPGLYGYVSACKWIVDMEVTTFEAAGAFWVTQGWIQQAPIVLSSRIDRPRAGQTIAAGQPFAIAGVAWDQHVGVSRVEVSVDGGEWMAATLASVPSVDCWRQWAVPWTPAGPGNHTLRVRAYDAKGNLQVGQPGGPYPGAATGWHTINVRVASAS